MRRLQNGNCFFTLKFLKAKGLKEKEDWNLLKRIRRIIIVELTEEIEKELDNYISSIEQLLAQEKPPECIQTNTCKKCAYYEYCYI